jgi:hypothetical protein
MMKNLLRVSALAAMLFCLFPLKTGNGEDNPLKPLSEQAVKYFKAASMTVTGVKKGSITLEKTTDSELTVGSRLEVFRPGETFYHPVTNEPLGRFEKPIGTAEIASKTAASYEAVVLNGTPVKGDTVRITGSKIRALFYQTKKMDWFLGDAYYRELKNTQRFELVDTPLDDEDIVKLTEEGKRLQTEVLILVDSVVENDKKYLRQRFFWIKDGKELLSGKSLYTDAYLEQLASSSDFFVASISEPMLTITLPMSSELIAIGDLNGDGEEEILIGHGSDVTVYKPGVDLRKLWELKGNRLGDNLYMDVFKTATKGLVVISTLLSDGVHSYIFELTGNDFTEVWHSKGFLRVVKDTLYYQAWSVYDAFGGKVEIMKYDGKFSKAGELKLPKGVNIYDFAIIEDSDKKERFVFYYDKDDHINLEDSQGAKIYRSKRNMGGFLNENKKPTSTVTTDTGNWHVSDKLYATGRKVTAVKRVPVTPTTPSLGFKNSYIMSYRYGGLSIEEDVLINDVSGTILDYAFYKDKVYVLARPMMGIKLSNILKGENPLISTLYVYSIIKF